MKVPHYALKYLNNRQKQQIRHVLSRIRFLRNVVHDAGRYYRLSTAFRPMSTKEQIRAHLTFEYHKIEKGLALPETRPGFGSDVVTNLMRDIVLYEEKYGVDDISVIVRDVLKEYSEAFDLDANPKQALNSFLAGGFPEVSITRRGGTITFPRDKFFPHTISDALSFIKSRRSARQFTGAPVSTEDLEEVISLAQEAPSVCNRQAGFAFCANDPMTIKSALSFQNGNRGFGHLLGAVIIVAADMSRFRSIGERHQPFIDGGIFAMAIVNALHAKHIGACMLNWSTEFGQDKALRAAFDIPDKYTIITMIGCGEVPPSIQVAASPRDPKALQWLGGNHT